MFPLNRAESVPDAMRLLNRNRVVIVVDTNVRHRRRVMTNDAQRACRWRRCNRMDAALDTSRCRERRATYRTRLRGHHRALGGASDSDRAMRGAVEATAAGSKWILALPGSMEPVLESSPYSPLTERRHTSVVV